LSVAEAAEQLDGRSGVGKNFGIDGDRGELELS
jgi:hypothetical protein